jgi:hypothetical protein
VKKISRFITGVDNASKHTKWVLYILDIFEERMKNRHWSQAKSIWNDLYFSLPKCEFKRALSAGKIYNILESKSKFNNAVKTLKNTQSGIANVAKYSNKIRAICIIAINIQEAVASVETVKGSLEEKRISPLQMKEAYEHMNRFMKLIKAPAVFMPFGLDEVFNQYADVFEAMRGTVNLVYNYSTNIQKKATSSTQSLRGNALGKGSYFFSGRSGLKLGVHRFLDEYEKKH